MSALLVVVAAPSGAGKTTLVKRLVAEHDDVVLSLSSTTRPPRPGEVHGEDYVFTDDAEFERAIAAGEFLEHAQVYGNRYGTHRDQVDAALGRECSVVLEIDHQGAAQVRRARPDAITVFILPPTREELERRLRGRATDDEEVIRHRLAEADEDLSHWGEFDHLIVNDDLDAALAELAEVVRGQRPPVVSPRARAVAEALSPA